MVKRYNWEVWKDRFIRGGDDMTLKVLARSPDAPAYNTLKQRAGREKWMQERETYRYQVNTKTREIVVDSIVQVKARHARTGSYLVQLATAAISTIVGTDGSGLGQLNLREAVQLLQMGADLERKALGMETLDLNLKGINDVTKLSDEQLDELELQLRQALANG